MRNKFDKRVAAHGITRSKWTLIAVIARKPGASQREIAELLEMTEAAVGRLIEKMCAEGLLERRAREDDRRAREVFLLPAAREILGTISAIAAEWEEGMFAGLDDAQLEVLGSALDQIYANVSTTMPDRSQKGRRQPQPAPPRNTQEGEDPPRG